MSGSTADGLRSVAVKLSLQSEERSLSTHLIEKNTSIALQQTNKQTANHNKKYIVCVCVCVCVCTKNGKPVHCKEKRIN
jgi:hypothetical protein